MNRWTLKLIGLLSETRLVWLRITSNRISAGRSKGERHCADICLEETIPVFFCTVAVSVSRVTIERREDTSRGRSWSRFFFLRDVSKRCVSQKLGSRAFNRLECIRIPCKSTGCCTFTIISTSKSSKIWKMWCTRTRDIKTKHLKNWQIVQTLLQLIALNREDILHRSSIFIMRE